MARGGHLGRLRLLGAGRWSASTPPAPGRDRAPGASLPCATGWWSPPGFHNSPCELARPAQYLLSLHAPARTPAGAPPRPARPCGSAGTALAEEGLPPGSGRAGLVPASDLGLGEAFPGALLAEVPVPLVRGGPPACTPSWIGGRTGPSPACVSTPAGRAPGGAPGRPPGGRRRRGGSVESLRLPHLGGAGGGGRQRRDGALPRDGRAARKKGRLRFCRSQVFAADGFAVPNEHSRPLLESCGPFFDMFTVGPHRRHRPAHLPGRHPLPGRVAAAGGATLPAPTGGGTCTGATGTSSTTSTTPR